jgi:prepilin peptidase CpaA
MLTASTPVIALPLAFSFAALAWGAVTDIRTYIIPNAVPLIIAIAYVAAAPAFPLPLAAGGLLTGLGVLALGLVLFTRGWMGGGDVKLFAALALWAGPSQISSLLIVTCLGALALAGLMLSPLRRLLPQASPDAVALAGGQSALRQPMPFGVAIAAGGLYVLALYLPVLR